MLDLMPGTLQVTAHVFLVPGIDRWVPLPAHIYIAKQLRGISHFGNGNGSQRKSQNLNPVPSDLRF